MGGVSGDGSTLDFHGGVSLMPELDIPAYASETASFVRGLVAGCNSRAQFHQVGRRGTIPLEVHDTRRWVPSPTLGGCQAILIDDQLGALYGATDHRKEMELRWGF